MSLSTSQIAVLALAVLAVLRIITGFVRGRKRGGTRAGVRLGLLALCVVGAFLITRYAAVHIEPVLEDVVKDRLGDLPETASQAMDASESLLHYVLDLVLSMVAPIVFLVVLGVLRFITWIIYLIVCAALPKKVDDRGKKQFSGASRVTGSVLSGAAAALLVFAMLTPAVGYITFATEVYGSLVEEELVKEDSLPSAARENIEGLENSTTLSIMGKLGTRGFFDAMTVMEDGETPATQEVFVLVELVPGVNGVTEIDFGSAFSGEGVLDMSAVDQGLLPILARSPHMCGVVAELMSTAAAKWLAEEDFLGINLKEQIPEDYKDALDAVLELVSNTTEEKVVQDLKTLSKTLALVSRSYTYMYMVDDYVNVTGEHLQTEMETILEEVDHETAGLLASALSDEFVSTSKLNEDGVEVVQTMVLHVLDDVADMEGEQKKREAAAINTLIMYASSSRQEEISATSLVNTIMSSETVRASIEEQTRIDPVSGTYKTVEVRADQKKALDEAIAVYAQTATPEEMESLNALQALFVGPQ